MFFDFVCSKLRRKSSEFNARHLSAWSDRREEWRFSFPRNFLPRLLSKRRMEHHSSSSNSKSKRVFVLLTTLLRYNVFFGFTTENFVLHRLFDCSMRRNFIFDFDGLLSSERIRRENCSQHQHWTCADRYFSTARCFYSFDVDHDSAVEQIFSLHHVTRRYFSHKNGSHLGHLLSKFESFTTDAQMDRTFIHRNSTGFSLLQINKNKSTIIESPRKTSNDRPARRRRRNCSIEIYSNLREIAASCRFESDFWSISCFEPSRPGLFVIKTKRIAKKTTRISLLLERRKLATRRSDDRSNNFDNFYVGFFNRFDNNFNSTNKFARFVDWFNEFERRDFQRLCFLSWWVDSRRSSSKLCFFWRSMKIVHSTCSKLIDFRLEE